MSDSSSYDRAEDNLLQGLPMSQSAFVVEQSHLLPESCGNNVLQRLSIQSVAPFLMRNSSTSSQPLALTKLIFLFSGVLNMFAGSQTPMLMPAGSLPETPARAHRLEDGAAWAYWPMRKPAAPMAETRLKCIVDDWALAGFENECSDRSSRPLDMQLNCEVVNGC
jgi:hypothetical protein